MESVHKVYAEDPRDPEGDNECFLMDGDDMVPFEHVRSSNVVGVGYMERTSDLWIQFGHGRVYRYSNVPKDVHAELMSAKSKGGYVARIADKYPYEHYGLITTEDGLS